MHKEWSKFWIIFCKFLKVENWDEFKGLRFKFWNFENHLFTFEEKERAKTLALFVKNFFFNFFSDRIYFFWRKFSTLFFSFFIFHFVVSKLMEGTKWRSLIWKIFVLFSKRKKKMKKYPATFFGAKNRTAKGYLKTE